MGKNLSILAQKFDPVTLKSNAMMILIIVLVGYSILQGYQFKRYKDRKSNKVGPRYRKKHPGFGGFYICSYCFRPVYCKNMQVDHIIPFDKGGPNQLWNLTASCEFCNQIKKAKMGLWTVRGYIGKIIVENLLL